MTESEINIIMQYVRKNNMCVHPDWQQFECTDDLKEVNFRNCSNCWRDFCEKLKDK